MNNQKETRQYSIAEEQLNISSHVFGLTLSVIALFFLVIRANQHGHVVCFFRDLP